MALPLAPFLLGIVGSAVGRVLTSLGFSVVVIAGVEASIGGLKSLVVNSVNTLPADVLMLFLLSGGGAALNIVLGAVAFRVSLWAITKSVRVLGVST